VVFIQHDNDNNNAPQVCRRRRELRSSHTVVSFVTFAISSLFFVSTHLNFAVTSLTHKTPNTPDNDNKQTMSEQPKPNQTIDLTVPSEWILFLKNFKCTSNDRQRTDLLNSCGLTPDSLIEKLSKLLCSDCDNSLKNSILIFIEENVSYFLNERER
jgi:hypothetical protein